MSLTPIPSLDQLAADPGRAQALPVEAVERLLAHVHVVQGALLARLLAARSHGNGQPEGSPEGDRLLGVAEAAHKLGISKDQLYRKPFPFTVKLGRQLRFSEKGIDRYIRQRQGR